MVGVVVFWVLVVSILWWTLPLITVVNMARRRNRARTGWFLATLIFGWICVLLLWPMVAKPARRGQQEATP